ncbi:MAG: hypothetical protein ACLP0A_05555 [Verrucomicrobiia bacterium]
MQETKAASVEPVENSAEELVSPAEMVYRRSNRASRNPGAPAEMTIKPEVLYVNGPSLRVVRHRI